MTVSLCLIARNEAFNLAACLSSVHSVVDEIIVVDTGSTDVHRREIAAQHGALVFDFPWRDDFAAARNEAIRHATCPWILSMDADDTLDADNLARLASLVASLPDTLDGYMMQVQSLGPRGNVISSVGHVRLFRNDPRIRWDHRIHEQIATSIEDAGGRIAPSDVVITHHGYADPAELKRKLERNMSLLVGGRRFRRTGVDVVRGVGAATRCRRRSGAAASSARGTHGGGRRIGRGRLGVDALVRRLRVSRLPGAAVAHGAVPAGFELLVEDDLAEVLADDADLLFASSSLRSYLAACL